MRESVKTQGKLKIKEVFTGSSWKSLLTKWSKESWQMVTTGFRECLVGKAFPQDTHEIFCFANLSYLIHQVSTHTIYTHIIHTLKGVLFREKTLAITLENERLLYPQFSTNPLGFIAQTLTTPILSVKWGFGTAEKHWKKSFVWWMQSGWIAWSRELEKTRLGEVSW